MRGGEKVLESICRLFPAADLLTLVHDRRSVSPLIESRVDPHVAGPAPAARDPLVPPLPADLPGRDRAVRPRRRGSGDFDEPLRGQGRRADRPRPCISATATRRCATPGISSTRTSVPNGSAGCRARSRVAPWRGSRGGTATRRIAWIGISPTPVTLPAESRGTIIVGQRSCTRRWIRRSSRRMRVPRRRRIFWWCPPWCRTSESTWRSTPPLASASRSNVVGTGPDDARLRARAGPTVEFLGAVEGPALRDLYRQRPCACCCPAKRTSASSPVEAMACGRPVIALGRGGATETVVPGVTGVLVDAPGADAFADGDAGGRARRHSTPRAIRAHAETFGTARFEAAFRRRRRRPAGGRVPDAEALQPPARRLLRRRGRPVGGRRVPARLPDPVRQLVRPSSCRSPRTSRRSRSTWSACR